MRILNTYLSIDFYTDFVKQRLVILPDGDVMPESHSEVGRSDMYIIK